MWVLLTQAGSASDETDGSISAPALREQPTTRDAVETMLRESADVYTDQRRASGCLIVLGATTRTPYNSGIRQYLSELRRRPES